MLQHAQSLASYLSVCFEAARGTELNELCDGSIIESVASALVLVLGCYGYTEIKDVPKEWKISTIFCWFCISYTISATYAWMNACYDNYCRK